jgi:hypothetical protein
MSSTLLVQHHGVVNSEMLDLAFIAFWNQTLHLFKITNLFPIGIVLGSKPADETV